MTILLGPLPCGACGTIVAVVRRRFLFRCSAHQGRCTSECREPSVVELDGATHICAGMMEAEEVRVTGGPAVTLRRDPVRVL